MPIKDISQAGVHLSHKKYLFTLKNYNDYGKHIIIIIKRIKSSAYNMIYSVPSLFIQLHVSNVRAGYKVKKTSIL